MRKRLFIAINLPEKIKDKIEIALADIRPKFPDGIRFLRRENWHLTIVFLGYQNDEAIGPILDSLKEAARRLAPPLIQFSEIGYGPAGGSPRMIWLSGGEETGNTLASIKKLTEKNLIQNQIPFKQENRLFRAHITLARFRRLNVHPDIRQKLHFQFQPKTLDLMESCLSRQGANYCLLQSFPFEL